MTSCIGEIEIPAISEVNIEEKTKTYDKSLKDWTTGTPIPIEIGYELGGFSAEIVAFRTFNKSVQEIIEDIRWLAKRDVHHNFFQVDEDEGWLIPDEISIDAVGDKQNVYVIDIDGNFYSKLDYDYFKSTLPNVQNNSYALTMNSSGCDGIIVISTNCSFTGDDIDNNSTTIQLRKTADGTIQFITSQTNSSIAVNILNNQHNIGECKLYENISELKRIYNADFLMNKPTSDAQMLIYNNGLIKVAPSTTTLSVYDGSAWKDISGNWDGISIYDVDADEYSNILMNTVSPDEINTLSKIRTGTYSYDMYLSMERGTYSLNMSIETIAGLSSENVSKCAMVQLDGNAFVFIPNASLIDSFTTNQTVPIRNTSNEDNYIGLINRSNYCAMCSRKLNDISYRSDNTSIHVEAGFTLPANDTSTSGYFSAWNMSSVMYLEAEDGTKSGSAVNASYAGAYPYNVDNTVKMTAQDDKVRLDITGLNVSDNIGNYTLFIKATDSNQITDDFGIQIRNTSDATDLLAKYTTTLTGSFAYYNTSVSIKSDDIGDGIEIYLTKETADANSIYVDYALLIPLNNLRKDGFRNIASQSIVDNNTKIELISKE